MPCIVHGAAKSWIQLSDFHFQMPAGVLTGAGGDHPPLPSFFPPKPKSCPQPTPSDVPLCHAPACCIFFEFQVLVFAPPHLASGIRHVRSLFPCSSRAQGLPQRWGVGGILSCTSVARFSCWVGVVVVATAFVGAPKEKPLDCWGGQGALHSWDPLDCDDLRVPGGPPALKGHRQQWKHTPHLSEKEAR